MKLSEIEKEIQEEKKNPKLREEHYKRDLDEFEKNLEFQTLRFWATIQASESTYHWLVKTRG